MLLVTGDTVVTRAETYFQGASSLMEETHIEQIIIRVMNITYSRSSTLSPREAGREEVEEAWGLSPTQFPQSSSFIPGGGLAASVPSAWLLLGKNIQLKAQLSLVDPFSVPIACKFSGYPFEFAICFLPKPWLI